MPLNLFSRVMPREESFTILFCQQTKRIVEASEELRKLVEPGTPSPPGVARISAIETAADDVARRIFIAANRTFNAPIDREDILALAHNLDDVVDLIDDAAKLIQRYNVHDFPEPMRSMVDAAVEASGVLVNVMPHLDNITGEHRAIFTLCERVGQIEGRADEHFDRGLSSVRAQMLAGEIDTIAYLDRKELYELIEDVVDKCDDVANVVESITAKHV
jgi:predicted phosphate transport protein (TIGR00153 family)